MGAFSNADHFEYLKDIVLLDIHLFTVMKHFGSISFARVIRQRYNETLPSKLFRIVVCGVSDMCS